MAAPARPVLDHDALRAACARQGIDPAHAEALWQDLAATTVRPVAAAPQGLGRVAFAAVAIGVLLVSAANAWWASLVYDAAGWGGLAAFALVWVVAFAVLAEVGRRRAQPTLAAGMAVVATAWAAVAGVGLVGIAGGTIDGAWSHGRLPVEVATLVVAVGAVRRFGEPLLTMFTVTAAAAALVVDAIIAATDGHRAAGAIALVVAAVVACAVIAIDRRAPRSWAFWPALLADGFALVGAPLFVGDAQPAGTAIALAAVTVAVRGLAGARLTQVGIGALGFWFGVLVATRGHGAGVTAAVLTLAGASLIGGVVVLARRRAAATRRT